jgi:hypothetical protein
MSMHCLVSRPPEQMPGGGVPERNASVTTKRDDGMNREGLDGETKNFRRDPGVAVFFRLLTHRRLRIGGPRRQ